MNSTTVRDKDATKASPGGQLVGEHFSGAGTIGTARACVVAVDLEGELARFTPTERKKN